MTKDTYEVKVYEGTDFESFRFLYKAIDAYKEVEDTKEWKVCKECNLVPLIWEYDNGRSTACGCGDSEYKHPSVRAKDIMTVMRESDNGMSMLEYDKELLKTNWNKTQS